VAAQSIPAPNFGQPIVNPDGTASRWFQTWITGAYQRLGGSVDKVDAAAATAGAAVPQATEVVAGSGLQAGGALNGNVGLALYAFRASVAELPTSTAFSDGDFAYAIDGRKVGEASGAGTGVPVWWSNGAWCAVDSGAVVAA